FRCWSSITNNKAEITKDLGRSFAIAKTFIKPFAACGANQVPMQIASTLAGHRLKAADIVRVVERLRPGTTDYAGLDYSGPFSSHVQALMSMQFCAAAAILGRPVYTPQFISESYNDPEVTEIAAKVELTCEEGRSMPGFEVYTTDGRVLIAEEQTIDRSIHLPTINGMRDKFRMLASGYLGKKITEEVIDLTISFDKVGDV
ncbi:unnamed protein product, partial [marine sediment metagenome]